MIRSNRCSILAATLTIALSACMHAAPEVEGRGEAIVNGELEQGRPEVVFLYNAQGSSCTGAIIAPRVVLTANHCVESNGQGSTLPASYFRVYVGSSARRASAEYRVSQVRPVPNAGLNGMQANDVAMLILSQPARETPLQIARSAPRTLTGQRVTAIGYGQTPSGGSGTKYRTTTSVDGVQDGFIFVDPSVCSGDSGGPLIGPDGLVYGVASFIYSPDGRTEPRCGTAPGAYNEIYRHLGFIDQVLEDTGICVPSGEETCNGEDDDCDGRVDEDCIAAGGACRESSECAGGLCADTPAGRICTSSCDPLRPGEGCGAGFYCAKSNACDGFCVPGAEGIGANDSTCTSDTQCRSLFCHDPGDGRRRCLDPCRGDQGLCLAGEVCAASPGACGGCVAKEIVRSSRGLGEPCEDDFECRAGMTCHDNSGVSECAAPCGAGNACTTGFECRAGLCIRDRRQGVGGVCADAPDCGEAVCASQGGRQWCTAQCTDRSSCPAGFDCVMAAGTRVCAPMEALLGEQCAANGDCVSDLCATLPGAGQVCTRFCDVRNACPAGFDCTRAGDGTTAVCVPAAYDADTSDGGCAVGARRRSGAGFAVLFAAALGWAVRRRRR